MSRTVSARLSTASRSGHGGQRAHDLRLGTVPNYVDKDRSSLNEIVIRPPTVNALADSALERRKARYERGDLSRQPRSIRRDASIAVEGIITFGADAQPVVDQLPHDEQAQRYEAAARAIAEHVGTDLVGLVIHRDESAPHAHFTLSGYAPNGDSVARKLTKGCLSKAQAAAARAFEDLGIERGKRIGARIADGEDSSNYINRSVSELHRDLPKELEAARAKAEAAREKAEAAEQRRIAAEEKATAAEGESARLEKRVATYQRRAETAEQRAKDAEAEAQRLQERLESLADADQTPPKTRRATVPTVEQRSFGPFSWQRVTGQQSLVYLRPTETKRWRGAVLKREQKARDDAKRQHKEAERLEKQRQQEARARQRLQDALIQPVVAPEPVEDAVAALWASQAEIITRYQVQMQVYEKIARVPPQGATDRQVAAALYRTGRDLGWDQQWFSVSDGIAREVIAMAIEDDRLHQISFRTDSAADLLEEARAERPEMDPEFDPLGEPPRPKDEFEM